jgi:hypothetical protein
LRLTSDGHVAFLQVAFDDFRRNAVSQTNLDSSRLWFAVLAQHPDDSRLTFEHWRTRRREVSLSLLSAILILLAAVCAISLLLRSLLPALTATAAVT